MKKTLLGTMAILLATGASSTTFAAANPFSDVPTNSWAYNAVATLAKDGVVNGFPNGTFQGQRPMTRFEMAQIVAKAMAHENLTLAEKQTVDRLALEFGDELKNLGVRVDALADKMDNVKFKGKVYYKYLDTQKDGNGSHSSYIKYKLKPSVKINDKITGYADISYKLNPEVDGDNEGKVSVSKVYVEDKVGSSKVTAGRFGFFLGDGLVFDSNMSGVGITGGNQVKYLAYIGRINDNKKGKTATDATADVYALQLKHNFTKDFSVTAGYTMVRNAEAFGSTDYKKGNGEALLLAKKKAEDKKKVLLGDLNNSTLQVLNNNLAKAAAEYDFAKTNGAPDLAQKKATLDAATKAYNEESPKAIDVAVKADPISPNAKAYLDAHNVELAALNKAKHDASAADIWYLGTKAKVAKNLVLSAGFAKNTKADEFNKSTTVQLAYRNASVKKAGDYDLFVAYRNLGKYASIVPTYDTVGRNEKGVEMGINYIPAQNVVTTVEYFNGKTLTTGDKPSVKVRRLMGEIQFLF